MPELNECENAYWDGWVEASAFTEITEPMSISPNWDHDEQCYWAGFNAKMAQRRENELVAA